MTPTHPSASTHSHISPHEPSRPTPHSRERRVIHPTHSKETVHAPRPSPRRHEPQGRPGMPPPHHVPCRTTSKGQDEPLSTPCRRIAPTQKRRTPLHTRPDHPQHIEEHLLHTPGDVPPPRTGTPPTPHPHDSSPPPPRNITHPSQESTPNVNTPSDPSTPTSTRTPGTCPTKGTRARQTSEKHRSHPHPPQELKRCPVPNRTLHHNRTCP